MNPASIFYWLEMRGRSVHLNWTQIQEFLLFEYKEKKQQEIAPKHQANVF